MATSLAWRVVQGELGEKRRVFVIPGLLTGEGLGCVFQTLLGALKVGDSSDGIALSSPLVRLSILCGLQGRGDLIVVAAHKYNDPLGREGLPSIV